MRTSENFWLAVNIVVYTFYDKGFYYLKGRVIMITITSWNVIQLDSRD